MSAKRPPEPRWDVPNPYGYANAIDSMGTIAAPLLAGVSAALAVFVIQSEQSFRWTNATLFLLVVAVSAFVGSVQVSVRARQYAVTPPEIESWWSDPSEPGCRQMLRMEQRQHRAQHKKLSDRARAAYNVGILAFLLAVASVLVPQSGVGEASPGRLAVIAVALLAFTIEIAWVVRVIFPPPPEEPTPVGPEWPPDYPEARGQLGR